MTDYFPAIIVAVIAALPGIAALYAQRRKTAADTASVLTGAALQMVTQAREDTRAVRQEMDLMRNELLRARDEVAGIRRDLVAALERVRVLEAENTRLITDLGKAEEVLISLTEENKVLREQFESLGHRPDTGPLRRKR